MENQDGLEWLMQLSDPDLTILNELLQDYDANSKSDGRYNAGSLEGSDHYPYTPATPSYNAAASMVGNEVLTQRHTVVPQRVRPMLETPQSAHPSNLGNGYDHMQHSSLNVSPADLGNDSMIIITAPEGYCETYDAESGDQMQANTPSLYSDTSCNTTQEFANDSQFEQDLSWLVLSPTSAGDLPSTLSPRRYSASAGSKRPSIDLGDDHEARPKRARSVKGRYDCSGCDKSFERACDQRKHFKNVHGAKPFGCELCDSRFPYPKDLRRHMRQVHHIISPAIQEEEVRPPRRYTSLKSVVSMLSKLQLWSKESPEEEDADNFILVTNDRCNFRKVCVKGVESPEALMREIGSAFGMHPGHVEDGLLRRCIGGGRLGARMRGTELMTAIGKAVAAGKTLELFLASKDDTRRNV